MTKVIEVVYPRKIELSDEVVTRELLLTNSSGAQSYCFIWEGEEELKLGDYVLCYSGSNNNLTVVRVLGEWDGPHQANKQIVCKLDLSAYIEREHKKRKAKELQNRLDKKLKDIEQFRKYEFLRQYDPDAAEMLNQLEELTGVRIGLPPPSVEQVSK